MRLHVSSKDDGGVWVLLAECNNVVTYVAVFSHGHRVMCRGKVGAYEERGCGSRRGDENGGEACGDVRGGGR